MVTFPILFLCIACLFTTLLRERCRIWATLGVMLGTTIFAVLLASLAKGWASGPVLGWQVPCAAGVALFFLASLFIHSNNLLQKGFVAVLSLTNFAYCLLLTPLFLGAMPFPVAGAAGGFLSVLITLLVYLVTGLCLYRPLQRFSERGPSVFLGGMLLLMLFQYLLCLGRLDGLFGIVSPTRRLLLATGFYCVLIFCFRSVYQAGRWQSLMAQHSLRDRMLEMEAGDFVDMLAAVREVRAAQKTGEYALDTVAELLRTGQLEKIPPYVEMAKGGSQAIPILVRYHENPYLNAVIATKAAFASQNSVAFECNAAYADAPVPTAELCILVNELLTRACSDAVACQEDMPRRVRFTAIPSEDALRLETVFTGALPEKRRFEPKGKQMGDLLAWLFDDTPQEETELRGLGNAAEIVLAHSGSLTVSSNDTDVIVRALLRF